MMKRIILAMIAGSLLIAGVGLQAADTPVHEQEKQAIPPYISEKLEQFYEETEPGSAQAQAQKQSKQAAFDSALANAKELQEQIKTGIKELYQQLEGLCKDNPDARPTGDLSHVPADVLKQFEGTFSQILSPEEMVKAREIIEVVYSVSKKLIPGFDPSKLLTIDLEYAKLIITALERLGPDLIAVQAKNYTPDVIPGTIYMVLANVLKGKDAQYIAGFMNATHTVGLGYLTNGAATLFVATQLPTTFKQHVTTGIKSLFCMGSVQPDDVLEKAADMQINKEVIDTYITKQLDLYKRHVLIERSAADEILHPREGQSFVAQAGLGATHAINVWKKVPLDKMTILYGLTNIDGIGLLPDNEKTKEVMLVGYFGLTIPANAFKGLPHIKTLAIAVGALSGKLVIEDNAFVGLDNLTYLYVHKLGGRGKGLGITKGLLAGLKSVEQLEIKDLRLSTIEPGAFDDLANLRVLSLENNALETIEANTFNGLSQLKLLYLSNNLIHQIDKHGFNGLTKLTLLDLKNNRLGGLSADVFTPLKQLRFVDVNGNPLPQDNLTTLRKKIRKGCYIAYPLEHMWKKGGWNLLPMRSELYRLNQELSIEPETEPEGQK